jgi:hypothetical protein
VLARQAPGDVRPFRVAGLALFAACELLPLAQPLALLPARRAGRAAPGVRRTAAAGGGDGEDGSGGQAQA